ncbi:hypothetical protein PHJA_002763400 [Phtheirospermum japonicum]|uniref:DUF4283 domain-containing protein n=1 Tax=Phtheirospermum japonicum TaxID=374723 RepID=A0A830DDY6_9LAMI|nr:hypothetical protein PHJA_002763400 [Phtheirospermum japonicum]
MKNSKITLFSGFVSYQMVREAYDAGRTGFGSLLSLGHSSGKTDRIYMKGPGGRGEVEVAVSGVLDQSKMELGLHSPIQISKGGLGIGNIVRTAASVASTAAKHAYAAAASSTRPSEEEMLPLKCCLMSISLPWENIAHDLLFKVSTPRRPESQNWVHSYPPKTTSLSSHLILKNPHQNLQVEGILKKRAPIPFWKRAPIVANSKIFTADPLSLEQGEIGQIDAILVESDVQTSHTDDCDVGPCLNLAIVKTPNPPRSLLEERELAVVTTGRVARKWPAPTPKSVVSTPSTTQEQPHVNAQPPPNTQSPVPGPTASTAPGPMKSYVEAVSTSNSSSALSIGLIKSQKPECLQASVNFKHAIIGKLSFGKPNISALGERMFSELWMRQELSIGKFSMRIFKWLPNFDFKCEPPVVPVRIRILDLPLEWLDLHTLKMIASLVGDFLNPDGPTLNKTRGDFARVCVGVNLENPLPWKIVVLCDETRIELDIDFEKMPS